MRYVASEEGWEGGRRTGQDGLRHATTVVSAAEFGDRARCGTVEVGLGR